MAALRCGLSRGRVLSTLCLISTPTTAWPHAFGERYDLPAPLSYFVIGAAATVALSFIVAALFVRRAPSESGDAGLVVPLGPLLPILRRLVQTIGVIALLLVVIGGLFGPPDPEENIAPVLVWIVWWVGFSFVVACCGDIWAVLDPWRTIFDWLDVAARRLGRIGGIRFGFSYPDRLGAWPAVLLLLLFVWIELLYPHAVEPSHLAWMVVVWSAVTLIGMAMFGVGAWRRNVDVFAIYFATLGRFAPIGVTEDGRGLMARAPGRRLIAPPVVSFAMVGFVVAMLATVLFDGLLGTSLMALAQRSLEAWLPGLANGSRYFSGTVGLVCVWLLFLGAYLVACFTTARLALDRSTLTIAKLFALTLVPIAIAYNVAHYFTYLLIYGQMMIPLLSDPFARGWDLFGTSMFDLDIGIVGAATTWRLALVSIVTGHIVSIWLAHRVALREFGTYRRAVIASVPLTVLMVIYTAISLLIMAEPLVRFTEPARVN